MEANNALPPQGTQRCILCNRFFQPHPKIKNRQKVCDNDDCQRLRQRLNHLDWLKRNPVNYKLWDQDYGKAWRQQNPNYWQKYRKQKQAQQSQKRKNSGTQLLLEALLNTYQTAKKEQLTQTKTENTSKESSAKKEQLESCFDCN